MTSALKIGVLVSGTGSNLQALLDAIAAKKLDAEVAVVLSNVATAKGLDRARAAGVPALVVDHKAFAHREDFDRAVADALRAHAVEWVVLAGFMRVITHVLLEAFPLRILNIHPALLPAFPGLHAQRQALDYGVRVAGCTVHLVDAGTDTGPIVAQAAVPVYSDDDEASLTKRILETEHALLPRVVQWIAEGKVRIVPAPDGRSRPRVMVEGERGS